MIALSKVLHIHIHMHTHVHILIHAQLPVNRIGTTYRAEGRHIHVDIVDVVYKYCATLVSEDIRVLSFAAPKDVIYADVDDVTYVDVDFITSRSRIIVPCRIIVPFGDFGFEI